MKKYLIIALFFLINYQVLSQKIIPELSLTSLKGSSFELRAQPNDQLILYSFWATWCIPCINELDAISEDYTGWQEETGMKLVAVSIDNARTKSKVRPMVNGRMWDYEVLYDDNQVFKRALNIPSVPYLIIVKNNKILYKHSGYTPGFEVELYEKIKELKTL
jgi:peroxiredoxin